MVWDDFETVLDLLMKNLKRGKYPREENPGRPKK